MGIVKEREAMGMATMYEVAIHGYGRPIIKRGPMAGCVGFEEHKWTRITARPIGLKRAKELADSQECHSVVLPWMSAGKVYDNGKEPHLPDGWRPARTTYAEEASQ